MPATIGLTYDLRSDYLARGFTEEQVAEFDKEDTIEGIEQGVRALGYATRRIGSITSLVEFLAGGGRCDMVFNIAEGCHGLSRETQVPALLDAYGIPYTFSDPIVLAVTHHKAIAKSVVRGAGIRTAAFALVERPQDVARVNLRYPLFAKPVAEGTGKGVSERSRVTGRAALADTCEYLLAAFNQPVLVEEYLPGREFTVGLLGAGADVEAVGVMEVVFRERVDDIYSYQTKRDYENLVDYRLVEGALGRACKELCCAAFQALGCRDAARIDLRLDAEGNPNFIEINALPGLNPTHSDLPIMCRLAGMNYGQLIERIMRSAAARCPALKAR